MTGRFFPILFLPLFLYACLSSNHDELARNQRLKDSIFAARDSVRKSDSAKAANAICNPALCSLLIRDSVNLETIQAAITQNPELDCNCTFQGEYTRLGARIPIIKEFMRTKTKAYNYNSTPLQFATVANDTALMRLLLDNGANPDFADSARAKPIVIALFTRNEEAFELLAKYKASLSGCYVNPRFLSEKQLKQTIACGADFNIPDVETRLDGVDPKTGHIRYRKETNLPVQQVSGSEKLKILLEAGARPNDTATGGTTLLHHLAVWGNETEIQLALAYKADLYIRNAQGELPLHIAARSILPGKLKILLPRYDLKKAGVTLTELIAIAEKEGNAETTYFLKKYSAKNKSDL